jgi:oligopeptide transport system substrate-binding protein
MGFIPPTIWREEPRSFFQDADQLEARRLFKLALQEMGICKEKLPPIRLSYNTMSLHNRIAQAVQEQWFQVLGVQVILEHKEWKVFLDELRAHRFQIARMAGGAPVNDPIAFLQFYKFPSSYTNLPQWENRQFTACLDRAEKTTDSQERLLLLRQAEQIFMEEMPIAPIYFCTDSYVKKPYVKGVFVSPTADIDFKYAYVEAK